MGRSQEDVLSTLSTATIVNNASPDTDHISVLTYTHGTWLVIPYKHLLTGLLKWCKGYIILLYFTARDLHARSRLKPLNHLVYHRGRRMWDKILEGTAADQGYATTLINNADYTNPHSWYPSSYDRSRLPEQAKISPPGLSKTTTVKTRYRQP